jgi:hypothetical protein
MKTDWHSAETETVLAHLGDSLEESIAHHRLILNLLLQKEADLPSELGKLFKDASNAYMAMSESVIQKSLLARSGDIK